MKKLASHQFYYLQAFILVLLLLAGAEYLQVYEGVAPCPLCILQRITFGILGVFFIIGVFLSRNRLGQVIIGLFSLIFSLLGIAQAGRQVWLQFQPAEAGANCEVSLQYMLNVLPFDEVIQKIFSGGPGCSIVNWQFLNLSLAQWSLGFFVGFLLFSMWQLRRG
jgi:disulfide bond formation protein DsbB